MPQLRFAVPAVFVCAAAIGQQWTVVDAAPKALSHVIYDRSQQRLLGVSYQPVATWSFDGTRWRRHMPDGIDVGTGPTSPLSARVWAAGFDDAAGQAVLAAEVYFSPPQQNVYVGRGAGWQQLAASVPPRFEAATAFDPVANQLIAFGGADYFSMFDTTLAWNGSTWIQRSPALRPSPRVGAAMATDYARGRVVLFGGRDSAGAYRDDTWEWNGTTWTAFAVATRPVGRIADMAYDPVAQKVVLLGGEDAFFSYVLDCHEWNGAQWTQRASLPALGTTRGYDDGNSLFAVIDADIWRAVATGWTAVHTEVEPMPWHYPAMAYDGTRGEVLLVSGAPRGGTRRWRGAWEFVTSSGPGARDLGGIAQLGSDMFLFGGADLGGAPQLVFGDTWRWNGQAWNAVTTAQSPPPRHSHAMVETNNGILLFGGSGALGQHQDTWRFDGVSWTSLPGQGPGPRVEHSMAYDPLRQRVVLYGGKGPGPATVLDDTWEWDGLAWTVANWSFPLQQYWYRPPMVFDPVVGAIVLADQDRLWRWNGSTWSLMAPSTAAAVTGLGVFDTQRQQMFVLARSSLLLTSTPAGAEITQQACGNRPDLRLLGRPALGTIADVHIEGAVNAAAFVVYGLQPQLVNWAPGCDQLVSADAVRFGVLGASGRLDVPLSVPVDRGLRGVDIRVQALVLDGGPVFGASLSGALRILLGD